MAWRACAIGLQLVSELHQNIGKRMRFGSSQLVRRERADTFSGFFKLCFSHVFTMSTKVVLSPGRMSGAVNWDGRVQRQVQCLVSLNSTISISWANQEPEVFFFWKFFQLDVVTDHQHEPVSTWTSQTRQFCSWRRDVRFGFFQISHSLSRSFLH